MITKKSVFAQVFVVMFALLLALSFAACSTPTVSGASVKSPDNVTLSLKSSTFSGTVGDNSQTTTNTYNVYYTGEKPSEVKISLGISAKDGWIDFKKPGIATINFPAVEGLTFASATGTNLNYADMEEDDWVVTIPAAKLDAATGVPEITAVLTNKAATPKQYSIVWKFEKWQTKTKAE